MIQPTSGKDIAIWNHKGGTGWDWHQLESLAPSHWRVLLLLTKRHLSYTHTEFRLNKTPLCDRPGFQLKSQGLQILEFSCLSLQVHFSILPFPLPTLGIPDIQNYWPINFYFWVPSPAWNASSLSAPNVSPLKPPPFGPLLGLILWKVFPAPRQLLSGSDTPQYSMQHTWHLLYYV